LELRDRVGATIYLAAAAKAAYAFTPLHDGDILEFGRVRLKALEATGATSGTPKALVVWSSSRCPGVTLWAILLNIGKALLNAAQSRSRRSAPELRANRRVFGSWAERRWGKLGQSHPRDSCR
jgi:hypothetical protein